MNFKEDAEKWAEEQLKNNSTEKEEDLIDAVINTRNITNIKLALKI